MTRLRSPTFGASFGAAGPALLALIFLAFHLPYLPASLEDLDSINFALGIRQFDVAHHQPHPPGYPVFMLIAKAMHTAVPSEATVLGLVSIVAGTLGVLAMAALYRRLDGPRSVSEECEHAPSRLAPPAKNGPNSQVVPREARLPGARGALLRRAPGRNAWSLAAVGVAMTSPLYWFTAVRPLSDVSGLAAALAVQAMTLGATSTRALTAASFCAGVGAGLRSQVAWLTVPLLIARGLGTWGLGTSGLGTWGLGTWGLGTTGGGVANSGEHAALDEKPVRQSPAPSSQSPAPSPQSLVPVLAAFAAGVLLWFVPLVIVTGGPAAYWRVLFNQGAEDLGNIQMLWTAHGARDVADALYYAFVAPWAAWPVASVILVCAALGAAWSYRHARHALFAIAAGFGPYLVFDLLFQETFTSRYALPLVIPTAYLAVAGTRVLPRRSGLVLAVAIAMFDAHVGGTSIAAYASLKAPAFRLLDDMASVARATGQTPVLAMDRRNAFDFRRPIVWADGAMAPIAQQLPAPPQHEWLEAVKYWTSGGRAPVWFIVDPKRTSIDLVQHDDPARYRWPLPYPVLASGARPNEMDWYQVDRPEWFVGEGWALTPEAAGVAETDRRDLAHTTIQGWVSRAALGGVLMVGGRNFDPATRPRLIVTLGGVTRDEAVLAPGPFLRFVDLPRIDVPRADVPSGASDYVPVTIGTSPPSRVAIEQFDASATRPVAGFGEGWHEQEFNPRTGLRWRWLSERGELRVRSASPRVTLHLEGESPRTYFSRGSRLAIRSRDQIIFDRVLADDFSLDVPITDAGDTIVLETDQVYVPAERSRRTQDRRHLGLRIFTCEIRAF